MNKEEKKERLISFISHYYFVEDGEVELLSTQDVVNRLRDFLPAEEEDIFDTLMAMEVPIAIIDGIPFWKLQIKRC